MIEFTTTRAQPADRPAPARLGLGDPGLPVPGRLVAGMMVDLRLVPVRRTGTAGLDSRRARCCRASVSSCLSLGMGALFLDLEHKLYVWRLYTTFQLASPMSWGAWILLARLPGAARHAARCARRRAASGAVPALARPFGRLAARAPGGARDRRRPIGPRRSRSASTPASCCRALGARPLWNSALLGPLFLASGLSTAAALAHCWPRPRRRATAAGAGRQPVPHARARAASALFLIGLATVDPGPHRGRAAAARRALHRGVLGGRRGARHRPAARHPVARRQPPHPSTRRSRRCSCLPAASCCASSSSTPASSAAGHGLL